jgi:transposase
MQLPSVSISKADLLTLRAFVRTGTHKAREISRAEVLLMVYERMDEERIAARTRRHVRTVRRVVARYIQGGLARAVYDAPRPGQPRKTTPKDDAHLIATACTKAPEGSEHWTLELLQKRLRKDRKKRLGTTAIWLRLKAHDIKPWREKNVVRPEAER